MRRYALLTVVALSALGSSACSSTSIRSRYATTDETLGLQRVVLYRNGVGYFERSGEIDGNLLRIKVRKDQINDLLKSLTVVDRKSGHALSVSMPLDPQTWANAALATLKPGQGSLAQVLDALRGVDVTLATTEGELRGRITMVERTLEEPDPSVRSGPAGAPTPLGKDYKVTLLRDDVFSVVRLSKVKGITLADGDLAVQFHRTLDATAGEGMFQQVSVAIRLAGDSSHDVAVSYVVSAPMWKPTYRVVLPEGGKGEALLQGWAVVDNTSGEDWSNVHLGLTSGAPIAFRYDLHTPREVDRQDMTESGVRKQVRVAIGETTFGGDEESAEEYDDASDVLSSRSMAPGSGGMPPPAPMVPAARGARADMARLSKASSYDHKPEEPRPVVDIASLARSTSAQARARQVSGLMQFDIEGRVTVPDSTSTMVAVINHMVNAEEVFLYQPQGAGTGYENNPFRVVRFKNSTPFVLEPGPISIYSGGSFVGEGLSDTVGAGVSATVPFAVEPGIMVTTASRSQPQEMRLLRISRGVLIVENFTRKQTTYTVQAQTLDTGFKLLVRHPRAGSEFKLKDRPEGTEELPDAYLIPIDVLQGKKSAELELIEQTPAQTSINIFDGRALPMLEKLIVAGDLAAADRTQVDEIIKLRREVGKVDAQIETLRKQEAKYNERAFQLRSSLRAIDENKSPEANAQRNTWQSELDKLLKEGQRLGLEQAKLEQDRADLVQKLEDKLEKLTIEVAKPSQ